MSIHSHQINDWQKFHSSLNCNHGGRYRTPFPIVVSFISPTPWSNPHTPLHFVKKKADAPLASAFSLSFFTLLKIFQLSRFRDVICHKNSSHIFIWTYADIFLYFISRQNLSSKLQFHPLFQSSPLDYHHLQSIFNHKIITKIHT